jgi:DNA-binding NtrC family response regulator
MTEKLPSVAFYCLLTIAERVPMTHEVAVLVSQESQYQALRSILSQGSYAACELGSIGAVSKYMSGRDEGVLIIDLDTGEVTNTALRELKKHHVLTIIALSSAHLHPNLEESLRNHIYACLKKPADPDELLYLLRSVFT